MKQFRSTTICLCNFRTAFVEAVSCEAGSAAVLASQSRVGLRSCDGHTAKSAPVPPGAARFQA